MAPPGRSPRLVLVDTTEGLTAISLSGGAPATVTAQAGATMDAIHTALEHAGYGLVGTPAIGDLTVAGGLAIGAHGTGVPDAGRPRPPGRASAP
ncbi:hypothetical protein ACFQ2B_31005 [Streptomyces stramineus]